MDKQYKVVPVDITSDMRRIIALFGETKTYNSASRLWKSILAAVPEQPSPAESDKEAVRNAALEEAIDAVSEYWGITEAKPRMVSVVKAIRALKSQPAQPNEWTEQDALLELIHMKFQSGNDVSVERITLTRDELDYVFPGLLK